MIRGAAIAAILVAGIEAASAQCASRCGPGFRLPSGRCASWDQHERFLRRGGYPPGSADERTPTYPGAERPPRAFVYDPRAVRVQCGLRGLPAAPIS